MIEQRKTATGWEYKGQDGNWYPVTVPGPRSKRDGESPDRARTRRNNATLARGRHPVTKLALLEPRGRSCGECAHHVVHRHAKAYHKCDRNHSAGPATDIRISWPACTGFEAA